MREYFNLWNGKYASSMFYELEKMYKAQKVLIQFIHLLCLNFNNKVFITKVANFMNFKVLFLVKTNFYLQHILKHTDIYSNSHYLANHLNPMKIFTKFNYFSNSLVSSNFGFVCTGKIYTYNFTFKFN